MPCKNCSCENCVKKNNTKTKENAELSKSDKRKCTKCKIIKSPISEFFHKVSKKERYRSECKDCRKARNARLYLERKNKKDLNK